jgi:sarcosine oxidase gamma subunit
VLELDASSTSLIGVFGEPGALDALDGVYRVAPDEAMAVGEPDTIATTLLEDPHAVVLDVTDGWAALTLSGANLRAAFARLSALRLPDEGFVQGDVARVPARVIVERDRLRILVPAMWAEHLRSQILRRCADLGIHGSGST